MVKVDLAWYSLASQLEYQPVRWEHCFGFSKVSLVMWSSPEVVVSGTPAEFGPLAKDTSSLSPRSLTELA